MTVKLSVCLTHYNRPHLLGRTLESLARQTRPPDEVFVRDDASPRDPTDVARSFAGRFRHFVYHRNPANLGMPGNLNAVIGQATGDLVANLHDADVFHPTLLEKWEQALHRQPRAGLVFCGLEEPGSRAGPRSRSSTISPPASTATPSSSARSWVRRGRRSGAR